MFQNIANRMCEECANSCESCDGKDEKSCITCKNGLFLNEK